MPAVRRYRLPALFCAFAVLLCELVARPFANMGVCDDGPYIIMARTLATTGRFLFNGWASPMLGWQLFLGAGFIKLFGFSFITVRLSTLLVATALAFFLQRTFVRAGITESNATLGTLALVLSPLYLMLSATYMTDIPGLFAIVICLYSCLRAIRAESTRTVIAWICFAIASNAICGTARQIAWLGVLILVPSTLWLLRAQRRVLLIGMAANLAGVLFIFACVRWLKRQPYVVPDVVHLGRFPVVYVAKNLTRFALDVPFLLLPIVALFLPQLRKLRLVTRLIVIAGILMYVVVAVYKGWLSLLQPIFGDWINITGGHIFLAQGSAPIFLHPGIRVVFTLATFGGVAGLIAALFASTKKPLASAEASKISWHQLRALLGPFFIGYSALLTFRAVTVATTGTPVIVDRYALGLLVILSIVLVRYYQDYLRPRLPLAAVLLVALSALFGIVIVHNMFAFYRARVALVAELQQSGVPETSVDNGWEYNIDVELRHADHVNNSGVTFPAHAYVPVPNPSTPTCQMFWYDFTPHVIPLYGASFDPHACDGPAPFAPVQYSRWLASAPGTLYVVRYPAPAKP